MKQSKAFKELQTFRDAINKGRTKILAKDLTSCVYLYEKENKFFAVGYKGRAKKQTVHYRFSSYDARMKWVNEWMLGWMKRETDKKESAKRELVVGDVLCSSWGYEQTNVDYYLVTKLIGKSMVELVEIGQLKEWDGDMSGRCTPDINNITGEPFKRRANGNRVKIDHNYAHKVDYQNVAGSRIYNASYFTCYH